jgi:hypothetical protein
MKHPVIAILLLIISTGNLFATDQFIEDPELTRYLVDQGYDVDNNLTIDSLEIVTCYEVSIDSTYHLANIEVLSNFPNLGFVQLYNQNLSSQHLVTHQRLEYYYFSIRIYNSNFDSLTIAGQEQIMIETNDGTQIDHLLVVEQAAILYLYSSNISTITIEAAVTELDVYQFESDRININTSYFLPSTVTSVRLSRPIHSRAPVLERAADEFCLVSI